MAAPLTFCMGDQGSPALESYIYCNICTVCKRVICAAKCSTWNIFT